MSAEKLRACSVRGVLAGGRAICGNVGCGEPWKCWSEEPCELQVKLGTAPKPETVANTTVCELGGNCRCAEGDEPGCWNWIGKGGV